MHLAGNLRLALLLPVLLGSPAALAASFSVSNTNDAGPGSLRQALLNANATAGAAHEIVFEASYPSEGQIDPLTPLPVIGRTLTIRGNNRLPAIDARGEFQIFVLAAPAAGLTLEGLTLLGGAASGVEARGGCIALGTAVAPATLVVRDALFSGCEAVGESAQGGAIHWERGSIEITDSQFGFNRAEKLSTQGNIAGAGGAIYAGLAQLDINGAQFSDNAAIGAPAAGGDISVLGGDPKLFNFVSYRGRAIAPAQSTSFGGSVSMDCAVDCSLNLAGAFITQASSDTGGALFMRSGTGQGGARLLLENTSLVGNSSASGGALNGVVIRFSARNSTFIDNASADGGHLKLFASEGGLITNSIFGPTAAGAGCAGLAPNALLVEGNLRAPGQCASVDASAPEIARFDYIGVSGGSGQVPVARFGAYSAVIDAGAGNSCLSVDAQLRTRPIDGDGNGQPICDPGAYEHSREALFRDGFES